MKKPVNKRQFHPNGKARSAKASSSERVLVRAGKKRENEKYIMRLFVAGMAPKSARAIDDVKKMCEEYLPGMYHLEIIDIYQQLEAAREHKFIAAPTLVKELPSPLRRLTGNMSNKEHFLVGLELKKEENDEETSSQRPS